MGARITRTHVQEEQSLAGADKSCGSHHGAVERVLFYKKGSVWEAEPHQVRVGGEKMTERQQWSCTTFTF